METAHTQPPPPAGIQSDISTARFGTGPVLVGFGLLFALSLFVLVYTVYSYLEYLGSDITDVVFPPEVGAAIAGSIALAGIVANGVALSALFGHRRQEQAWRAPAIGANDWARQLLFHTVPALLMVYVSPLATLAGGIGLVLVAIHTMRTAQRS